jgi:hypothetical protein
MARMAGIDDSSTTTSRLVFGAGFFSGIVLTPGMRLPAKNEGRTWTGGDGSSAGGAGLSSTDGPGMGRSFITGVASTGGGFIGGGTASGLVATGIGARSSAPGD